MKAHSGLAIQIVMNSMKYQKRKKVRKSESSSLGDGEEDVGVVLALLQRVHRFALPARARLHENRFRPNYS